VAAGLREASSRFALHYLAARSRTAILAELGLRGCCSGVSASSGDAMGGAVLVAVGVALLWLAHVAANTARNRAECVWTAAWRWRFRCGGHPGYQDDLMSICSLDLLSPPAICSDGVGMR
jgi:hypothetical protein